MNNFEYLKPFNCVKEQQYLCWNKVATTFIKNKISHKLFTNKSNIYPSRCVQTNEVEVQVYGRG